MPPPLARIDVTEPLETILHAIEKDGGVIVTNFLSLDLLKESMEASECGLQHHLMYTDILQSSLTSLATNCMTPKPHTKNLEQTSFQKDPKEFM